MAKSSTRGDRKQFIKIIDSAKDQNEIIAVVADKVGRLQHRNKEVRILDALIQEGKIEIHFNTKGYIAHRDSKSHERMMWGVVIAQSYTDCLHDNIKKYPVKTKKRRTDKHSSYGLS
ncbi:hypothetical protein RLOatenuis_6280 [Rickettsiales bacterium]|nr:hypothetical protein RLOatenuis_6280 [Rickettsiales bacterium]